MSLAVGVFAEGRYPTTRHDGTPWQGQSERASIAKQSVGYHVAITMVKGDWPEFANTLAFPTCAHHANPCFACTCTGGPSGTMANYSGTSPVSLPFVPKAMGSYLAACLACEKLALVRSQGQLQRMLGRPGCDKRKGGQPGAL